MTAGALRYRCPSCKAPAYVDEDRSRDERTFLQCTGCGRGELVDAHERDGAWNGAVPAARSGAEATAAAEPPDHRALGYACPQCGALGAYPDETRSRLEFTWMQCDACGHGGLYDSWEREDDWRRAPRAAPSPAASLEPAPSPTPAPTPAPPAPAAGAAATWGCKRCRADDAEAAFEAAHAQRVRRLIDESHFDISVSQCDCRQLYATVFTERIDWRGEGDPHEYLVLPITATELTQLRGDEPELVAFLERIGAGRRFLVRAYPCDPARSTWWRDDGFCIGRHD